MAAVLGFLGSRWFLTGIGVALLCVLLWLLGPLWAVLDNTWVLAGITAALVVLWIGLNLLADMRRRRRDRDLVDGLTAPDPAAQAGDEEVAKLRDRLTKAMDLLRKASGKRGYLYEQPWYVIIGPPGSGKTTALQNANLVFPLAGETGEIEVPGSGGTKLCEWYFTDKAVVIDTAGRYTTRESDEAKDRAGWEGFLDLLRRTRPRQPLNGVIVAIAVNELVEGMDELRLAHARAVRRRLKELNDRLGVRLPVYVVFTKADMLSGFTEYFDDLDRTRRAQVWGMTFPVTGPPGGAKAGFTQELRSLVEVLAARVNDRLHDERAIDRRPAILGFPAQVASLEAPLAEFIEEAFGERQLDPAAFLRGCYFASGTQDGTLIDRLVGAMARTFGIDRGSVASLRPQAGRSYFLESLIKTVILGEAMLVANNPAQRRRRMILQAATWGLAGLLLIGGSAVLLTSWQRNTAAVTRFDTAVAAWRGKVEASTLSPVAAADLHRVLPLLDDARALPFGPDSTDSSGWGLGMSQDDTLRDAARLLYQSALERIMLPRLFWRAEQRMRENMNAADRLYEHTRIYLMLGSKGPFDAAAIRDWAVSDWDRYLYPGAANKPLRDALARHLTTLLTRSPPPLPVNDGLVEDARAVFSNTPLEVRVYAALRMADSRARGWAPGDAVAAGEAKWFTRKSGAPMTEEIPGLFTPDGFWTSIVPGLPIAITRVSREQWVLGSRTAIDDDPRARQELGGKVFTLYGQEYIRRWREMLDDLDIVVRTAPHDVVADLDVLSSAGSPMRKMLEAAGRNLTLAPPVAPAPAAAPTTLAGQAAQAVGTALASRAVTPDMERAVQTVDRNFAELREFTASGLDIVLRRLTELKQVMEARTLGGAMSFTTNPVGSLQSQRIPQPLRAWVDRITSRVQVVGAASQRQAVAAAYNSGAPGGGGGAAAGGGGAPVPPPGPLCKAMERRYPFTLEGADASIEEFSRLFGPGGSMDQFFRSQISQYVAIQGNAWRPQAAMGGDPPVSAADVAVFQRIDRIRQSFFPFGQSPRATFLVRPISADPETRKAVLELGPLRATFQSDQPSTATQFDWPGPGGMTTAQLTFDPPAASGAQNFTTGPWALFRLFAKARRTGTDEQFTLTFVQGPRQATFEVMAGRDNPFSPSLLANFRCPAIGP